MNKNTTHTLTHELLKWHQGISRPMPWKNEKDPYKIWLSEVIMQQTRVEQGLPYYNRIIKEYPSVDALAMAEEDDVLKNWEGLGYYSRARNMHKAAKKIVDDHKSSLPDSYEGLLSLPGVGPYTASAIASFAFDLPHAVIDGNVQRIISRFLALEEAVDTREGRKQIEALLQDLIPHSSPGAFNQAMMDLGALVCTPYNPRCEECPFNTACRAYSQQTVHDFPKKKSKTKVSTRYFHYLVIKHGAQRYIRKRTDNDIWKGLYEFPMIEADDLWEATEIEEKVKELDILNTVKVSIQRSKGPYKQKLSHRWIIALFIEIETDREPDLEKYRLINIDHRSLTTFAFPRIMSWYFMDNTLNLKSIK